ncbi:MAG: RNA methyltransferase [Bacteroidales bacterium]|nr:RNA methyltransferase [Bacteroidales bacterium]
MSQKLTTQQMCRLTVEQFRQAEKLPVVVVLDNVRSQNNIGSVFRTADAFRIERIELCGICSTPPHREIHKTALGAEESVAWGYTADTAECLRRLKSEGYKIYAVEQVDDSVKLDRWHESAASRAEKLAIVLGNEVDGVQPSLLPLCDGSIEIPQAGTKHSLNVSCAAAIVMWELFKGYPID